MTAEVAVSFLLGVYAGFVSAASLGMLGQEPVMTHSHMKTELMKYGIIPEVLDNIPAHVLEVIYGDIDEVKFGGKMKTEILSPPPHTVIWPSDESKFYSLMMIDPDYPLRVNPSDREFLHWLVVNIQDDNVLGGIDVAEYFSPIPEPGSGPHRYIFLVFEQPKGKMNCTEPFSDIYHDEHRQKFKALKFAQKYGLGTPEAINFLIGERFINGSETTKEASSDTIRKLLNKSGEESQEEVYEDWIKELREDNERLLINERKLRDQLDHLERQILHFPDSTDNETYTFLMGSLLNVTAELNLLDVKTGKAVCAFECEAVCSFLDLLQNALCDRYEIIKPKLGYDKVAIWSKILVEYQDDPEKNEFPEMKSLCDKARAKNILGVLPRYIQSIYYELSKFIQRCNSNVYSILPTRPLIKKELRDTLDILTDPDVWNFPSDTKQILKFKYLRKSIDLLKGLI